MPVSDHRPAPRVGLVLGAGGIAGWTFHTGVLEALQQITGWDPRTADMIVGTSAGSGIGSLLRGNVSIETILQRMVSLSNDPHSMAKLREISGRNLRFTDFRIGPSSARLALRELARGPRVRPVRLFTAMMPSGPINTESVGEGPDDLHGESWPERPLWIVAVDLESGDRVVFGHPDGHGRGERVRCDVSVADAVRASCAIPSFFQPMTIDGRRHIDGGVHSPTNADLVADSRLDLVVILSPMSMSQVMPMMPISTSIRMLPSVSLRSEVAALRQAGTQVLVLEPNPEVVRVLGRNPMDPTTIVPGLIESSAAAFAELAQESLSGRLDVLRRAAGAHPAPADVAYPVAAL